jgi:hypothetical protein
MTLGRVRRDLLPELDPRTWEFFVGRNGQGQPEWTAHLERAAMVLRAPGQVSMNGIHYLSPLGLYLMPQWHYLYPQDTSGLDWVSFVTTSPTRLVFYTAPAPWGPWTQVYAEQFSEGWYNPCIPAKFIRDDGSGFVLFAAGLGGKDMEHYGLNLFDVELDLAE